MQKPDFSGGYSCPTPLLCSISLIFIAILIIGIILSGVILPNDKKEKEEEPIGFNPTIETDYLGKGEPITVAPKEEQFIDQTIEQLYHIFDIESLRKIGGG